MPNILIRKLTGHSGCNLNLYKNEECIFLRKDAGSVSYNKRLKKQYAKQKNFSLKGVFTPQVLSHGFTENGLFYFDMEYINGVSLAEYMKEIRIKEIVELVSLLFKSLSVKTAKQSNTAHQVFTAKIYNLQETLNTQSQTVSNAFSILNHFDFSQIPLSECCGDLTLENIIISSKGIYVIDLLDSFYNSWMIDIAKLFQDIDLGWSYRYTNKDFGLNLRLATAKQAILDNILALKNGKKQLREIYHILLLNILRIYPYAQDKTTFDFLENACNNVMQTILDLEK